KTLKIQAGVQVSRPGELRRHLQLWKCFGRLYYVVIVLVRNISCQVSLASQARDYKYPLHTSMDGKKFTFVKLDKWGRKGTSRDKEETRQAANASHSKGRRNPNALPVTKEQNNQLCTVDRKKQDADPNSLCESSTTRNGDLLHFNR
ncbi:hypothetical protein Tco_1267188, partial [Tanacetum coccineum]